MSDGGSFGKRSPFYRDEDTEYEPMISGWQLIGDSQFLRFSEKFLGKTRKKKNGLAYMGLCVSGQKTGELLDRVEREWQPISKHVIIMIGTNDLLKGTPSPELRGNVHKLVVHLHNVTTVEDIIILTIPPVPRLAKSSDHWKTLKAYNEHIKTFEHKGGKVRVIDAYHSFIKRNDSRSSPSSLVSLSHSSGYSSPLLRKSNHLNIPPYTSNFDKIRTNLRIRVDDPQNRVVYVLDSDEEGDDSEDDSYTSRKTTPARKRSSSFSSEWATPNPKRRLHGSGFGDIAQDDHSDSFCSDNSDHVEEAEEIILEYFEKYFDTEGTRPDLIHLNFKGLRVIEGLIREAITAVST